MTIKRLIELRTNRGEKMENKNYKESMKIGIFGSSKISDKSLIPELREIGTRLENIEIVITGAVPGYPYEVVQGLYNLKREALILGISPFKDVREHIEKGLITDNHDIIFYTGLGSNIQGNAAYQARNIVNVALSESGFILPGSEGTLNELELCVKNNKPVILFSGVDKIWDRKTEDLLKKHHYTRYVRSENAQDMIEAWRLIR